MPARGLVVSVLVGLACRVVGYAEEPIVLDRPDIAARVARSVAAGTATADTIRSEIERCDGTSSPLPGCQGRLLDVLDALASEGPTQREMVLKAISTVRTAGLAPTLVEGLLELAGPTGGPSAQALAQRSARAAYIGAYRAGLRAEGPPTGADIGKPTDYLGRLVIHTEALLSIDPRERLSEALQAGTANDCGTAYGGRATQVCEGIGLHNVHLASLRLAVEPLRECRGEAETVSLFLEVDRKLLEKAIGEALGSEGFNLEGAYTVLDRWIKKTPTRWEAWADIEECVRAGLP